VEKNRSKGFHCNPGPAGNALNSITSNSSGNSCFHWKSLSYQTEIKIKRNTAVHKCIKTL